MPTLSSVADDKLVGRAEAAGRPSNWEDQRRSSYGGRRSRRNSVSDDSQLTIENFGGSQVPMTFLPPSPFCSKKTNPKLKIKNCKNNDLKYYCFTRNKIKNCILLSTGQSAQLRPKESRQRSRSAHWKADGGRGASTTCSFERPGRVRKWSSVDPRRQRLRQR